MDDASKAPQPQFSGHHAPLGARLERALDDLLHGADAEALLDELQERAEQEGQQGELALAYAELLTSNQLESLPRAARLELYLQAAWLCGQRDGLEATTLRAATSALELAPADERALAMAEPLLLEAEHYAELGNRYAIAASSAGSEARARQLLERAIHMLSPLPAAAPAVLGLNERLQELSALRDNDEVLLAIAHGADGAQRDGALVELGERWLAAGSAREGAARLKVDPAVVENDAALDVLERLFDHSEDGARLERTLLRRVELEPSASGRGRRLEKLAAFHHDFRGDDASAGRVQLAAAQAYRAAKDADEAERAYERLLDLEPDHLFAACELVRLRGAAGNFAGVADAFGVVLRKSDDNRAATALLLELSEDAQRAGAAEEFSELADSVLWRLSEVDRELAATLLRTSARLFTSSTRYDDAAELYRRLIADNATSEDIDAYQALIEAHPGSEWRRNQQRWLFEWQEHHTADRPSILLEWARFEEQELGDRQAALGVLARAAELAPDRPEIWENLTRLRLSEGDGAGGLQAAGELRRLGREVDASLLGLLLEQEPTARWALDRVKLTLSAEQRWPELYNLYERAIDASDDVKARAELLDEAAIAARDVAQDRARALDFWRRHAELVPNDARVDVALERLYGQAGDRRGLIAHIRRRFGLAPAETRPALLERIADLSLDEGLLVEALNAAEQLSDLDAGKSAVLLERLLERGIALREQAESLPPARRAAQLLRERASNEGDAPARARFLRAELSLVDGGERRALLSELSRLCEKELNDSDGAFDAEREVFVSSLGERERKRLEKLAKKTGRYAELCDCYVAAAEHGPLEQRRALLLRAADVAEQRLQDREQARCLARRMYELQPELARATFEALREQRGEAATAFEALCWLLEDTARYPELGSVLEQAVKRGGTPELLTRLGRLQADHLAAPAAAITTHLAANDAQAAAEVFLRAPSVFGDEPRVVLELARRLTGAGEPEGALRVLRHQLQHYEQRSPAQRKLVQLELVQVLRVTGATDAAARELSETAKRYPTDVEVQRACAASAAQREDWERAEQCYRALLLLLHGGERAELCRAPVYVALADIKRRRGAGPEAEELLESGFEAALGSPLELMALASSLLDAEQWAAAERACSDLLQLASDLPTAARALAGAAQLLAHRSSAQLLSRASDAARSAVARADELPAGEERSRLLAACVALLPLDPARELLASRAGELASSDRLNAELSVYGRMLELPEREPRTEAAERLEQLVHRPEAPARAFALLAGAFRASQEPEKLALALAGWLERAPLETEVLSQALDNALERQDVEHALGYADRLKRAGGSPSSETTGELRKLCVKAGKTEQAVSLLLQEAAHEKQAPKRAASLLEAAELLFGAGEPVAALDLAREARSLDPASADAVLLLARLALADGERQQALTLLCAHAEAKERRRGKPLARVLRLAADLHLGQDELAEALPLLQEAHQLDKTDLDSALLLGLLAIDLDRLETAASALRVLIAQRELGTREGAATRSLNFARGYFQLARIEQHHGKKTNAKRMALRALEEDPSLAAAQQLLSELGIS